MLLLLPKFDSGRDLVYNLLKQNVMAKSENVIRGRIEKRTFVEHIDVLFHEQVIPVHRRIFGRQPPDIP